MQKNDPAVLSLEGDVMLGQMIDHPGGEAGGIGKRDAGLGDKGIQSHSPVGPVRCWPASASISGCRGPTVAGPKSYSLIGCNAKAVLVSFY